MTYLTDSQITEMAEAALVSYEITASWNSANTAAAEYAADELGVKPTSAQIATAINKAKIGWTAISYATKKAVKNAV
jgi:hypothetical protein